MLLDAPRLTIECRESGRRAEVGGGAFDNVYVCGGRIVSKR